MKKVFIEIIKQLVSAKLKEFLKSLSIDLLKQGVDYIESELQKKMLNVDTIAQVTAVNWNIPYPIALEIVKTIKKHLDK